jgi:hypothetical protein
MSRLDKKIASIQEQKQGKGTDTYYNPTKNFKTYERSQYDSSSMMDTAYETYRTPTQRPTTPSILTSVGMFNTLRQNQAQTQKIGQAQAKKLGIGLISSLAAAQGLRQSQIQGQGQKQAQKQLQQQIQHQTQEQKQIQKQTEELYEDYKTTETIPTQKFINKPPQQPGYIPDTIKPYTPPPIVPLWLPGGGGHGGSKRGRSMYPNYFTSMKYHPILTASQVSRIILGGKRR